jgi:hypothetical protein
MIDGLLSIKPIQKTEGKMDKSKIPLLTKDGPIQVWTLVLPSCGKGGAAPFAGRITLLCS